MGDPSGAAARLKAVFLMEAVLNRLDLSDEQWDRVKDLVSSGESDHGVTGRDNRMFVEAVL